MENLPRGVVTFLFTDIEGSTRLWEDLPEQMPAAYARHDTIMSRAVEQHGGRIYKTIGDALQIAFPSALQAIQAAHDAQVALLAEPWTLPEPLRVRMALHTGEVDPDLRGDYRSPVLNRLGRLLGAGHGGQVLASEAIVAQVGEDMPDGVSFVDLGARRLKDLGLPEHVYQLVAPQLGRVFPELRTLDARPHNLPTLLSRFIGRKNDMSSLRNLFGRDGARLVTLTGPGGIGKTRLSIQVGAEMLESFDDGVFLVRLETITKPDQVMPAIAHVLGLEDRDKVESALVDYLHDKQMLLILDNLEQVIESATRIGDLISKCPRIHVLATSRARLQLRGEHEYPLSPLGLPDVIGHRSIATLSEFDSMTLFVDRAQAVTPAFRLTDDNAWVVAEICLRLDGIPLAIELAAARIRMFPPSALLKRLAVRLPLLTGGARDLPERHQTLRQTVAWSYELLDAPGQALFRRLSVFAGGATLEAIEAVAVDPGDGWDALAVLERLVDQSLLRQTALDAEPRFAMFEVIREFGLEQLLTEGEADEAKRRHATYFAEYPGLGYDGATSGEAIRQVDLEGIERHNIRVAREWTLPHDLTLAYRLLDRKGLLWNWRVPTLEELRWSRAVVAANPPDIEPFLRARCCTITAYLGYWFPDDLDGLEESVCMAREALAIFRTMSQPKWVLRTLDVCGNLEFSRGRFAECAIYRQESVEIARTVDEPIPLSIMLENSGRLAHFTRDLERARALLEESREIAQKIPDRPDLLAGKLLALGDLGLTEGDLASAERDYIEAMLLLVDQRQSTQFLIAMVGLANVSARSGHWEHAVWLGGAIQAYRAQQEISVPWDFKEILREHEDHMVAAPDHLPKDVVAQLLVEGAAAPLDVVIGRATGTEQPSGHDRRTPVMP